MLSESPTLAMSARAKELKAQGKAVLDFSAGEPDFSPPPAVTAAVTEYLQTKPVHYAPVPGMPALRDAAAAEFARYHGRAVTRGEILVSCGAKHSLANLFMVTLSPGDSLVLRGTVRNTCSRPWPGAGDGELRLGARLFRHPATGEVVREFRAPLGSLPESPDDLVAFQDVGALVPPGEIGSRRDGGDRQDQQTGGERRRPQTSRGGHGRPPRGCDGEEGAQGHRITSSCRPPGIDDLCCTVGGRSIQRPVSQPTGARAGGSPAGPDCRAGRRAPLRNRGQGFQSTWCSSR